jgi:hypothetical protein
MSPRLCGAVLLLGACLEPGAALAQARSNAQDPALDNLVHPPGYQPAPAGSLGEVHTPRAAGPVT